MATRKPCPHATFPTKSGRLLPRSWRSRSRRRSTAHPRLARGVQWTEVDRAHRLCLALYATRLAAVGSRLSADEEVAGGWRIRGDGPRFFARTLLATFGGQSARSDGDHTGLPHPAIHAGERLSGRLRRGEAQEGYEGTRGGGYPGTLARLARRSEEHTSELQSRQYL